MMAVGRLFLGRNAEMGCSLEGAGQVSCPQGLHNVNTEIVRAGRGHRGEGHMRGEGKGYGKRRRGGEGENMYLYFSAYHSMWWYGT